MSRSSLASPQFQSRANSNSIVFSEAEDQFVEPSESDLEEFARRIGIDPVQESHLLHLAHEGLMHKLPSNWKPCFEPHRKVWYYYNSDTYKSQWEHPMNEVYIQKVAQARTENAMNRIQSFDTTTPKILKDLPPLRLKSGMQLGPMSSAGNVASDNALFSTPTGGPKKLQPLTIPTVLKKSSGLTVTGGGASFLKTPLQKGESPEAASAGPTSNGSLQESGSGPKMIIPSAVPLGQRSGSPLKGILANSMPRTLYEESRASTSSLNNWDPNPNFMTVQEKRLWNSLEDGDSRRPKGSVKFSIDEDPELKFESASQSERNPVSEQSGSGDSTGTSRSNTEGEDDDEEDEEEMSKSSSHRQEKVERQYSLLVPMKPVMSSIRSGSMDGTVKLSDPKSKDTEKPLSWQIGGGEKSTEKELIDSTKNATENLRREMENRLKIIQEELEVEERERKNQMKKHLEQVLEETKDQNEETIRRFKETLEKQSQSDLEKTNREMEAILNREINKLREENQAKIKIEKEKLLKEQNKILADLDSEFKQAEKGPLLEEMRKNALAAIEVELQEEFKGVKEAMREDQRRQTQHMKDYHASFLSKLKGEFKVEEEKIRNQQTLNLAEIVAAQMKENDEIINTFKASQENMIKELKEEYDQKRKGMETLMIDSITSDPTNGRRDSQSHRTNVPNNKKTSDSEERDKELLALKIQYAELLEKYNYLKQSLQNVTSEPNKIKVNRASETDVMLNTSFVEQITGQGDLSNSHSDEAGTSLDISGSDIKKGSVKGTRLDELRASSEDRVTKALAALDVLRDQILEIKSEQVITVEKPEPMIGRKGNKKNNVHQRRGSDILRQTKKASESLRTQSRSVTDMQSNRKTGDRPDDPDISEEESRHLLVEEAKDFIKSQKRRLSRNIPGFGLNRPTIPSANLSPGLKDEQRGRASLTNLRRNEHIYSETESSGLGSLKSLPGSKESVQVSKDIDAILNSLKKLDKQMKYLWSVVGTEKSTPNRSKFKDQSIIELPSTEALLAPLIHPVSPPAVAQLNRLVDQPKVDYPLPTKSNSSILNEFTSRYSFGPTYINDGNSSLMMHLNRVSHSNFNLDEHVNNLRNAQARINQLPQDDMSSSLREKTRDLREWLEKF